MKTRLLLAAALSIAVVTTLAVRNRDSVPVAGAAAEPDFDSHWHDGRAELDGYRLEVTRYGERRTGQATAIYVTEPFSKKNLVKVDDHTRDPADTFDALKLNLTRDFQTGIYDYNTMVSVFVKSADFSPVKASFSSMEWCGNVYEELRRTGATWHQCISSYFEGETGEATLEHPANGLLEDELWIRLRGLRGPYLEPGERRTISLLPGSFHRRLAHRTATWSKATIERLPKPENVTVPAGTFACSVYAVNMENREGRFLVETAFPHRIVLWEWKPTATRGPGSAERGELTGTDRVAYWRMNGNGDERNLERLGLRPIPIP
jgi:hypothetical protein